MEAPPVERRLVAILAADVEGYSRLMHGDEEATMATLSARRAVVNDLIGQHRGRIANTAGDSVLAEFISVLDAVHCAIEIQEALARANDSEPEERRMRFRIGVNVGDVMAKEGDIFGDGVNVAARLEGLVRGGEICVSRGVRDHLRHRGGMIFEDLGEQLVKNIAHPIRAFRLRASEGSWEQEAPSPGGDPESTELPTARAAISELSADNEVALELALWDSVKDGSPAELESSLEQYPEGTFASLAQTRVEAAGFRQLRRCRQPRNPPLMLSTLPSGIPSRTATGGRSCGLTSSNIPTAISPGSPAPASQNMTLSCSGIQHKSRRRQRYCCPPSIQTTISPSTPRTPVGQSRRTQLRSAARSDHTPQDGSDRAVTLRRFAAPLGRTKQERGAKDRERGRLGDTATAEIHLIIRVD